MCERRFYSFENCKCKPCTLYICTRKGCRGPRAVTAKAKGRCGKCAELKHGLNKDKQTMQDEQDREKLRAERAAKYARPGDILVNSKGQYLEPASASKTSYTEDIKVDQNLLKDLILQVLKSVYPNTQAQEVHDGEVPYDATRDLMARGASSVPLKRVSFAPEQQVAPPPNAEAKVLPNYAPQLAQMVASQAGEHSQRAARDMLQPPVAQGRAQTKSPVAQTGPPSGRCQDLSALDQQYKDIYFDDQDLDVEDDLDSRRIGNEPAYNSKAHR